MMNNTILVNQNENVKLLASKRSVEWLVENTEVAFFNPISFEGYQRKINDNHCRKIVDYLKNDFLLPTAIICAAKKEDDINTRLRVVDGQHRIEALRIIKNELIDRYNEIKDKELPVIIIITNEERIEIETFITINKTSKKVDTSLAYILRNRIDKYSSSQDLTMPKSEFLAVEIAVQLNEEQKSIWNNKISFEGPLYENQLISLNAFVKSTKSLIVELVKQGILKLEWKNDEEVKVCKEKCIEYISCIWKEIKDKWPELFNGDDSLRKIIQGAIGYTSINRAIITLWRNKEEMDTSDFSSFIHNKIQSMNINYKMWVPGEFFSSFSSEYGYSVVAAEIIKSISE